MRFTIGLLIGLLLGWIFPIEGPIDYVYDDYVKPKKSQVIIPATKEKKPIQYEEEEVEQPFNFFSFIKEDENE